MLPLVAALIAFACAAASARRLHFALTATTLDPEVLLVALRGDAGRALAPAVRAELARAPEGAWERELMDALALEGQARIAMVNEQLGDLDFRIQRWSRVPRVCASIATSSGFLLASLALRNALASDDASIDVDRAVTSAVNVAAIGIAGAAFCIAVQYRARKVAAARALAADKLVERLESLAT